MPAGAEWHDGDLGFAQPTGRPIDKKTDYNDSTVACRPPESGTSGCLTASTPPLNWVELRDSNP